MQRGYNYQIRNQLISGSLQDSINIKGMKKEQIQEQAYNFEDHSGHSDTGVEFWLARKLKYLQRYSKWRNLTKVISKMKIVLEVSGNAVFDHIVDVNNMVEIGSGTHT